MGKNTLISNPRTTQNTYGTIPEIKTKDYHFPEGCIYLKEGEHRGVNRGFGVKHIWAEHSKELIASGYVTINDVARYISDLIIPRLAIHCEFNNLKGNNRISVLRSSMGIVYLEEMKDGMNNTYYSVVTAFPKGKAHGTQIGTTR